MYFLVRFAKCNYSYHVLSIKFVRSILCHALGSVLHFVRFVQRCMNPKPKINETEKSHSVFLQLQSANTSSFDGIGFCDRVVCAPLFRRLKRQSGIEGTTCISNSYIYWFRHIFILSVPEVQIQICHSKFIFHSSISSSPTITTTIWFWCFSVALTEFLKLSREIILKYW